MRFSSCRRWSLRRPFQGPPSPTKTEGRRAHQLAAVSYLRGDLPPSAEDAPDQTTHPDERCLDVWSRSPHDLVRSSGIAARLAWHSSRSATRHATGHPRLAAARGARVTASESARARHDELDVVGTGDLTDIARLNQARIPFGQRRRQAGRERPPGTALGPVAGAKRGVAHAPFLIVRSGRR